MKKKLLAGFGIAVLLALSFAVFEKFSAKEAEVSDMSRAESSIEEKVVLPGSADITPNFEFENPKKVFAFYLSWNPKSVESLKQNHELIDMVGVTGYLIDENLNIKNDVGPDLDELIDTDDIEIFPVLMNLSDADTAHNIVRTEESRKKVIGKIIKEFRRNPSYDGLNLDIENVDEADKSNYLQFVKELYAELRENDLKLILDLPVLDETLDYEALSENSDYVILMMYDQHYVTGKPGPIASIPWTKSILEDSKIPKEKLLGGVGTYGYNWKVDSKQVATGSSLDFDSIAHLSVVENVEIRWDEESQNHFMKYVKDDVSHEIWFLDRTTLYYQLNALLKRGSSGIAIWKLGGEDPGIWEVIKGIRSRNESLSSPDSLLNLKDRAKIGL